MFLNVLKTLVNLSMNALIYRKRFHKKRMYCNFSLSNISHGFDCFRTPTNEYETRTEDRVISFTWSIPGFAELRGGQMPIRSNILRMETKKWRALITDDRELSVQLVAFCDPQAVQIR